MSADQIIQRKRARRGAAHLAAVHEISRRINAVHDPDAMAEAVAEALQRRFRLACSAVLWFDEPAQELVVAAVRGDANPPAPGTRHSSSRGIFGRAARTCQTQLIRDTRLDPDYVPLGELGRSTLCIPIQRNGHLLGVIDLESNAVEAFDERDAEVVGTIADTLALAVENARLYADAQAKAERLEVLNALGQAMIGALELHQLFETFARQATRLMGTDRVSLALVEGAEFHVLAVEPGLANGMGVEAWLPREGTAMQWALDNDQTLVRPDLAQPPHFADDDRLIQVGLRTALAVPLRARGRVLGTCNAGWSTPHALTAAQVHTFESVAKQFAVALDNAQLHADLAERAARLQHAYSQLEEANQLKDQMIQNISHELRLPLTLVKGYIGLILDGAICEIPAALAEALATINGRTDEMVAIVERITTLHGLRLGGLDLERVSLSDLARGMAEKRREAVLRAGQVLSLELPDEDLEVQGNAERLEQALDSLFDNAIKFNSPGGSVRLRMDGSHGLVTTEVIDTGIGIPADKLDRVWDYFYQVDGSTTRRYGGMGMGLALVKEIVEAHGGAVWARSAEGQGSTFGFGLRRAL